MVQVLLLTRGGLAEEWRRATEAICGRPLRGLETLVLDWDGALEDDRAHVCTKVQEMLARGPVLILTDLPGSTPTNLACEHARAGEVAVVTGANLPMVVRLACDDRETPDPAALGDWICQKGRGTIRRIAGGGERSGE